MPLLSRTFALLSSVEPPLSSTELLAPMGTFAPTIAFQSRSEPIRVYQSLSEPIRFPPISSE